MGLYIGSIPGRGGHRSNHCGLGACIGGRRRDGGMGGTPEAMVHREAAAKAVQTTRRPESPEWVAPLAEAVQGALQDGIRILKESAAGVMVAHIDTVARAAADLSQIAGGAPHSKVWHEDRGESCDIMTHFSLTLDKVKTETIASKLQQTEGALGLFRAFESKFRVLDSAQGFGCDISALDTAAVAMTRSQVTRLELLCCRALLKSTDKKTKLLKYLSEFSSTAKCDWRGAGRMAPDLKDLVERQIA